MSLVETVERIMKQPAAVEAVIPIHGRGEVVLLVFSDPGDWRMVGITAEDMLTYPEPPEDPEIREVFYGPHDHDKLRIIAANTTTGHIQFMVMGRIQKDLN